MTFKLIDLKKGMFLVTADGVEVGSIEKAGRNSSWNAFCGIGDNAKFVGCSYEKQNAILMATDGKKREVNPPKS
jgi:hypothetical protein